MWLNSCILSFVCFTCFATSIYCAVALSVQFLCVCVFFSFPFRFLRLFLFGLQRICHHCNNHTLTRSQTFPFVLPMETATTKSVQRNSLETHLFIIYSSANIGNCTLTCVFIWDYRLCICLFDVECQCVFVMYSKNALKKRTRNYHTLESEQRFYTCKQMQSKWLWLISAFIICDWM